MDLRLFPYQEEGAFWLAARKRGFLADDMGLGKTAQAITAAEHALTAFEDANPMQTNVLVIAPARNIPTWEVQIAEWARTDARPWFHLMSYEKATEDLANADPYDMPYQAVIIDEAHRLKNPAAKRTKVIYNRINRIKHVWPMSGTPMLNGPHEIWTHLYCLRSSLLPRGANNKPMDYDEFREHFCIVVEPFKRGGEPRVKGAKNVEELASLIEPFFLRRTAEQVGVELPSVLTGEIIVRAEPSDLLPISRACGDLVIDQDGLPTNETEFSTARKMIGIVKASAFCDFFEDELEDNPHEKYVVMAWTTEAIDILALRLRRFGVFVLDGRTRPSSVSDGVRLFQSDPDHRVFVGQIVAAGEGQTLTAARNLIFLERAWSPKVNEQAMKRIHRIGQKASTVLVRDVILKGSLDEAVMRINRAKELIISDFF